MMAKLFSLGTRQMQALVLAERNELSTTSLTYVAGDSSSAAKTISQLAKDGILEVHRTRSSARGKRKDIPIYTLAEPWSLHYDELGIPHLCYGDEKEEEA